MIASVNWLNPVNGDWTTVTDWSTGAVPTSSDDVTIGVSGCYVVTITNQPEEDRYGQP